jgi:hypothetical protein
MSERIIDHPISSAGPVKTLIVLIAWTLFAFAGAYHWTTFPLLAGAMLLGAIVFAKRLDQGLHAAGHRRIERRGMKYFHPELGSG